MNAESRVPHTHGGTDAPECTPYGIPCRPQTADLPRYTWDQAEILGMFPTSAFSGFFAIPDGTIRRWASEGLLQARGLGPNRAKLYLSSEVNEVCLRERKTAGRKPKSHT